MLFSCSSYKSVKKSCYENGNIRYKNPMKNNKLNGVAKYWSEEGDLINEVEYFNGLLHGEWREYFPSSGIKSVSRYKFDKKDGLQVTYHINGNKKTETYFTDGTQISETLRWTIDGLLIK